MGGTIDPFQFLPTAGPAHEELNTPDVDISNDRWRQGPLAVLDAGWWAEPMSRALDEDQLKHLEAANLKLRYGNDATGANGVWFSMCGLMHFFL